MSTLIVLIFVNYLNIEYIAAQYWSYNFILQVIDGTSYVAR